MKKVKVLVLLLALILVFSITGCNNGVAENESLIPSDMKVEASDEVIQVALEKVEESISFYSNPWFLLDDKGEPAKIKILDSEITNLQFVYRADVYDKMVGERVVNGIKSAYEDYYIFSYRLLPDQEELQENPNLSFDLDSDGWISFEKITPYTSDVIPGDLFLIVRYMDDVIRSSDLVRTADFTEAFVKQKVEERYTFYDRGSLESLNIPILEYSFVFPGEKPVTVTLSGKVPVMPEYLIIDREDDILTGYMADYMTEILYENNGLFLMRTLNYGMPDDENFLSFVNYLFTDMAFGPKTFRGIGVGSTEEELLSLYKEDLYYLDKEEAMINNPTNHDVDYGYFYYPEDGSGRDITFYVRDKKLVFVEMISAYERRYD